MQSITSVGRAERVGLCDPHGTVWDFVTQRTESVREVDEMAPASMEASYTDWRSGTEGLSIQSTGEQ